MSTEKFELELAPDLGGSIARFDYVGGGVRQHLLRPAAPDVADVLGMASFPLVPYANRIRDGQFVCDDVTVQLEPNMADDLSPLHGQGWLNPWQVASTGERNARISFVHEPGEWPWQYEAWQDYVLDEGGLTVTLGCRNLSTARMPCGLAQHPYFPCDEATTLSAPVETAWTADARTLPVSIVPAHGRYSLHERKICRAGLDNAFEGWRGAADFRWPGQAVGLRMSSPDAGRFHVYAPLDGDYFAAEPVQNAVTALNGPQASWPAAGIEMLADGECRLLTMRLDIS